MQWYSCPHPSLLNWNTLQEPLKFFKPLKQVNSPSPLPFFACFCCFPHCPEDKGSSRTALPTPARGWAQPGTVATVQWENSFPLPAHFPGSRHREGEPLHPFLLLSRPQPHLHPAPEQPNWGRHKWLWSFSFPRGSGEAAMGSGGGVEGKGGVNGVSKEKK